MAVRALKVVQKTSHLEYRVAKQAGVADLVVGFKEWLSGKARGFLDFAGDIGRWVKGFVERTKMVGRAQSDMSKAFDNARREIDKAMA